MDSSSLSQELLDSLLDSVRGALQQKYGNRLVGLVLYGSTVVPPLKPATDLDLFAVVDGLPKKRRLRIDEALQVEDQASVQEALKRLKDAGHHLTLSLTLRSIEEASKFSPLYLDWPERSRILHDPQGLMKGLVEKTRDYIQQSGARKIQRGLLWYWDLGQGKTMDDEFEIGWK